MYWIMGSGDATDGAQVVLLILCLEVQTVGDLTSQVARSVHFDNFARNGCTLRSGSVVARREKLGVAAVKSSMVKSVVNGLMAITVGIDFIQKVHDTPSCKIPPPSRVKPKNYTADSGSTFDTNLVDIMIECIFITVF